MKPMSCKNPSNLERATQLLSWWSSDPELEDAGASPLAWLHAFVFEANSTIVRANARQADLIAALNEEICSLTLQAMKTHDPKIVVGLEAEIGARIRRCVVECSENWTSLAFGGGMPKALPKPEPESCVHPSVARQLNRPPETRPFDKLSAPAGIYTIGSPAGNGLAARTE